MMRFAAVLVAGVLLHGCSVAEGEEPRLAVGSDAPALWADDGTQRPLLAWVFDGNDYLGCEAVARDLRRLQARYGDALRLSLVYVGDDPERFARFVKAERLEAELASMRGREHRRELGGASLSTFFLVREGRVLATMASPSGAQAGGSYDLALMRKVAELLETEGSSWSGGPVLDHSTTKGDE